MLFYISLCYLSHFKICITPLILKDKALVFCPPHLIECNAAGFQGQLYDGKTTVLRVVKFIATENKMVVSRGYGSKRVMENYCLMGLEFQFCQMKSSRS